ncbi:MAG: CinA family protein [Bacteroidota bacterium]
MKNRASELVKELSGRSLTLALGESMTCGLAANRLNSRRGTKDVLAGSMVCYRPESKTRALKVPAHVIRKFSAESQQVTDAMAKNLHRLFSADIYAAITGLSAPGGSESRSKPVGTVFMSVWYRKKLFRKRKLFRGRPQQIKAKACEALFALILDTIKS